MKPEIKKKIVKVLIIIVIVILIIVVVYTIKHRYYDVTFVSKDNRVLDDKLVDDVSQMNETPIDKVYYIHNTDDIISVINYAKINKKQISIRGTMHTMGGHTINKNGYIIDTSKFNKVLHFDKEKMKIIVEPGMIWSDLISYLDKHHLSPMILQSYSSFSIGGTISVCAHGITSDHGIHKSILKLGLINSDGKHIICNRKNHEELFSLVIGGYGLFGIITFVKLKLVKNVRLSLQYFKLNKTLFHDKYQEILKDSSVNIKLARININNFNDISMYIFRTTDSEGLESKVSEKKREMSKLSQLLYKWIMPDPLFQKLRFNIEDIKKKPIDMKGDKYERNLILYESAEPLAKLYSPIFNMNATHILQEFFIPATPLLYFMFVIYLKELFEHRAKQYKYIKLLNITIRYVYKDGISFLKYAKRDMYAFVIYYRLPNRQEADEELRKIHELLTVKTLELGGTFYLPYRHHYNKEQLKTAYPEIDEFLRLKTKYDQDNIFSNLWHTKYNK